MSDYAINSIKTDYQAKEVQLSYKIEDQMYYLQSGIRKKRRPRATTSMEERLRKRDIMNFSDIENWQDCFSIPLWPSEDLPSSVSIGNEGWRNFFSSNSRTWSFWREWYQGFLDGKPVDWELQRRVALIPDADWEKGPAHIAEKIEEIKAQFLAGKAPLAETVAFNEETAKFHTVPREIAKPDLLGATLSQLDDALDDVLADQTNGLHDGSREVKVLRRTVAKYGNDPQRIEMDFTSVHAGLTRQIVVGELPASEGNLGLQRALEEGAQAIRATHPEVEENRRILTAQKLKEMDAGQKEVFADAREVLADISEGQLREDFEADISFIVEDRPPYIPPVSAAEYDPVIAEYNETIRVLARVAKIGILLRQTPELIHRIDKSAAYKGARILTTIAAIITIGIALL